MADAEDEKPEKPAETGNPDEDDEDDSEDEEEPEEEGAAPQGVPMKGDVTLSDGRVFWQGLWADDEAAHAEGKAKKFKYGGPQLEPGASLENIPDGRWHGYFFNPTEAGDQKVKEKGVKLTFSGGKVTGSGENEFGEFSIKGTYTCSGDAGRLEARKKYLYPDADSGDEDEIEDAPPENVDEEIGGLEADAEIPIEELRARMAAFEEEERKAKKARVD